MDGLQKGHKYIKLNSCYAAGGNDFHLKETFAKQLAQELGQRGYENIAVGGYQNSLVSPADPNDRKTSSYERKEGAETKLVSNEVHGGRTWYDKSGNTIHTGALSGIVSSP